MGKTFEEKSNLLSGIDRKGGGEPNGYYEWVLPMPKFVGVFFQQVLGGMSPSSFSDEFSVILGEMKKLVSF